jgi:excisionase family DNA binding protein
MSARLLTAEQLSELVLGVPPSWILEQARRDAIPHVRLGRYVRFDPLEVEEWWHARARGPWRTNGSAAQAAAKKVGS